VNHNGTEKLHNVCNRSSSGLGESFSLEDTHGSVRFWLDVADMKNSPHPGIVVFEECMAPLGLTITDAAAALGVTRNTLSELVNGQRGISPEMAVRLSKVFGGNAESCCAAGTIRSLPRFAPIG